MYTLFSISPKKLRKELDKKSKKQASHSPAVFRILTYAFELYPTEEVDFDSFSVDDVEEAYTEALSYDCSLPSVLEDITEYMDYEEFKYKQGNAIYQFLNIFEACRNLHATSFKTFPEDDYF